MRGTVRFEQVSEEAPTVIAFKIEGNDPSAERGMHIHQFGDNTNGCTSAGPHCTISSSSLLFFLSSLLFPPLPHITWRSVGGGGAGGRASTTHIAREIIKI